MLYVQHIQCSFYVCVGSNIVFKLEHSWHVMKYVRELSCLLHASFLLFLVLFSPFPSITFRVSSESVCQLYRAFMERYRIFCEV